MQGPSMQPTLYTGYELTVSPLQPSDQLHRSDIIVFHAPGQPTEEPAYIKRVSALPGETVEFRNTQLFIDGQPVDEPYIKEPCEASRCVDRIWKLVTDEYFVLGDNRNHSSDSRAFGPVKRGLIIGKAITFTNPAASSSNAANNANATPNAFQLTATSIVATNDYVQILINQTETATAH